MMSIPEKLQPMQLITLKLAAELLAVSKRKLYRLIAAKEFPQPIKVGAASRVRVSDIEAYINRDQHKGAR